MHAKISTISLIKKKKTLKFVKSFFFNTNVPFCNFAILHFLSSFGGYIIGGSKRKRIYLYIILYILYIIYIRAPAHENCKMAKLQNGIRAQSHNNLMHDLHIHWCMISTFIGA